MKLKCDPHIPWKLMEREAEEIKQEMIKYQTEVLGLDLKKASQTADILIQTSNSVAEELEENIEA